MTDQDEFVQKTSAKKRGAGRSRWYHIHVNSFSPGSGVLRPGFLLAAGIIVLGVLVAVRIRDDDTALRLGAMDAYCEAVSPGLCAELDRWATENNWPTWLCGPECLTRNKYSSRLVFRAYPRKCHHGNHLYTPSP